ncbi:MAG: hypothetical protein HDR92_02515 [Bacteroides sp.]|nr:hypothetical protein [Bacteroides sp.]
MMTVKEIIEKRVSVRTFDDRQELGDKDIEAIRQSIRDASTPFGGSFTIDFKKFDLRGPQSPSTYGTISGASWYLLMGISNDEMSALSAGYGMEKVVLKATELGLGTCWMTLTFKGTDFAKKAQMPVNEPIRIISPVGFPAKKRKMLESITRITLGSAKRKPMDELFSEGSFGLPVVEDNVFYEALSMMRLAPSAKNSQPWRALLRGNEVWFYYVPKTEAAVLDLGIGLCHFDLTLKEAGYEGTWAKSVNAPYKDGYIPVVKFTLK